MKAETRKKKIKRASWLGITGNGLLSAVKIWIGSIAGSSALIGAGLDDATDIAGSFVTLIAAEIADRPPDQEHPYGHGRAETIAARLLSVLIIMAGAQLLVITIGKIVRGEESVVPDIIAVYVSIAAIAAKIVLFVYKLRVGREVNSQMVTADAMNMRADIVLTVSVLIGLLASLLTGIPIIDRIMTVAVGLWILKNGISLFMESNDEVMEGLKNTDIYKKVFNALLEVEGISKPHRVRIRKINTMFVVDLDIEVDGNLTVYQGHELAKKAEEVLRKNIDSLYDVVIHIEPEGNFEADEPYGLTEESLD